MRPSMSTTAPIVYASPPWPAWLALEVHHAASDRGRGDRLRMRSFEPGQATLHIEDAAHAAWLETNEQRLMVT